MSALRSERITISHSSDVPWHDRELASIATGIADGALSPVALTRAMLERIAALDPILRSYALVTGDTALAQAAEAEAAIAAGRRRGPLHGVPIALKDLLWTEGVPTAGGTLVHRDFRPHEDATVVARLKAAGAVIIGKTQMTEGAFSDHHPAISAPKNPWNSAYWPGISSSGSGVAVAAGLCFGAIGSDTGGSIRWPSAANGITGLKPTWGRVSRHGALELAASLDHIGPMARSVADVAILLQAMAGPDRKDPTALADPVPDYSAACQGSLDGLRIAIDPAWNREDVDPPTREAVEAALEVLRGLGARCVEIRFPDVTDVVADSIGHLGVEAAVAHEATYPRSKDQYGPVFAAALEIGRGMSAGDYQKILLRRAEFRGRVDVALAGIDLLLTPVQPQAPLTLDAVGVMGARPDFVGRLARFTYPFDATGHPTLTLPGGADVGGMPIGIQLVGRRLREPVLLKAGSAFQRTTDWHRRRPANDPEAAI